jgi:transcriptional regulator with GAF, ATPase, and Fis domain
VPARAWQFVADLALAAGRANTPRGLARSLGESLGPRWRVARVRIVANSAALEAVERGGRWTVRDIEPPARRPTGSSLRSLKTGQCLTLVLPDVAVTLRLGRDAPELPATGDYLEALVDVLSAAVDRQSLVQRVARLSQRAHTESRKLRAAVDALSNAPRVVAHSPPMKAALERLAMVAGFDTPVLIAGESGTGKQVLARLIHGRSGRRDGPFVQINCGAIPEALVESELFGHVRGAFTGAERDHRGVFERAEGGTLLLDEVGDLPLAAQVKLLRVLQERALTPVGGEREQPVDARIIAATHRDLRAMAAAATFREDLLYRLDVFPIAVPSLRQRREDLPGLVADLLDGLAARLGVDRPPVTADLLEALAGHRWPGNVRELANVLEAAMICGGGERLELPASFAPSPDPGTERVRPFAEACRAAIAAALEVSRGKIYGRGGAAELLELKPATLQSKMRKLGVKRRHFAGD